MVVSRKVLFLVIVLVLISPIFGVILADMVGYHEPLDVAAEILGLNDITEDINWTPFLDYTVPGLPDVLGYIVSGFIGVGVILALGYVLKHFTSKEKV
ncbi:MAG: cobalamin biosynthesis protein [Thermoprotei archaeon]|nr:MAG: cobalamin biosynthesis protein [Thermoprotei archaeon]